MNIELFLILLVVSANATSIFIQIIKTILDKLGAKYKSVTLAVVAASIVGIVEIFIYYGMKGLTIDVLTFLYAICMGVANAVGATTSYDLVKKFINALFGK